MTESPSKKLRQRRASLGALQGDPEAPAAGTLHARRQRLLAELERAQVVPAGGGVAVGHPHEGAGLHLALSERTVPEIMHELRQVDDQIEEVQRSIDEIDDELTGRRGKVRRSG